MKTKEYKVLNGFFQAISIDKEQTKSCIRTVDRLDKIGKAKVKESLLLEGLSESQSFSIINFTQIKEDTNGVINQLEIETQCN
jgi:histidyl-tRNA synthetase